MTTDTRHLDTALAILGAGRKATRRPKGTVITVYDLGTTGASVQVNSKEVWLAPDMARARADAARRKAAMGLLGRTVSIVEY